MAAEITDIITAVASVFAAGAVGTGVYQYKKDQIHRRKETLFLLIDEFDDGEHKMTIAKALLDGFKYKRGYWENPTTIKYEYYGMDVPEIFRHHYPDPIYDDGEMKIRDSFDSILDFFGKLGYLLEVGLLKKNEIQYFEYHIKKAAMSENVGNYVSNYNFPLYLKLLTHLGLEQNGYCPKN